MVSLCIVMHPVGLGCVLMKHEKVIAYASRQLRCMRETIQLMILN